MTGTQAGLFVLPAALPSHPAEYTEALYPTMAKMLTGCTKVLDPFGGKGNVFMLERWQPSIEFYAVEIEPEWCNAHPKTEQGNALHLRWPDGYFDGICTSPAYGNEMAVGLGNREKWARKWKTYRYADMLGRHLHPDNGAAIKWGDKYRTFHLAAWTEARRVLREGGKFVLNIKDHYRAGKRQYVTDWHIETLKSLGFVYQEEKQVACPGMRYGANADLRMEYESVILFECNPQHAARLALARQRGAAWVENDLTPF